MIQQNAIKIVMIRTDNQYLYTESEAGFEVLCSTFIGIQFVGIKKTKGLKLPSSPQKYIL
jgi:hypothetical protein